METSSCFNIRSLSNYKNKTYFIKCAPNSVPTYAIIINRLEKIDYKFNSYVCNIVVIP